MRRHLAALAALVGLTLVQTAAASAGTFGVDPVMATFDEGRASSVITVTNRSHDVTRFQVSTFAWQQSEAGAMQLQPSDDVLAFPMIFVLAPGEQRRVRVAPASGPTASERAYRLFVQELPPLDAVTGAGPGLGLSIRTKIGIPVFIGPASARANAQIGTTVVRDGALVTDVVNDGTAHTIVHKVVARFLDASGRVIDTEQADGWYLLANEKRAFRFALKPSVLAQARRVHLDVALDGGSLSKTADLGAAHS